MKKLLIVAIIISLAVLCHAKSIDTQDKFLIVVNENDTKNKTVSNEVIQNETTIKTEDNVFKFEPTKLNMTTNSTKQMYKFEAKDARVYGGRDLLKAEENNNYQQVVLGSKKQLIPNSKHILSSSSMPVAIPQLDNNIPAPENNIPYMVMMFKLCPIPMANHIPISEQQGQYISTPNTYQILYPHNRIPKMIVQYVQPVPEENLGSNVDSYVMQATNGYGQESGNVYNIVEDKGNAIYPPENYYQINNVPEMKHTNAHAFAGNAYEAPKTHGYDIKTVAPTPTKQSTNEIYLSGPFMRTKNVQPIQMEKPNDPIVYAAALTAEPANKYYGYEPQQKPRYHHKDVNYDTVQHTYIPQLKAIKYTTAAVYKPKNNPQIKIIAHEKSRRENKYNSPSMYEYAQMKNYSNHKIRPQAQKAINPYDIKIYALSDINKHKY